ncbi:MAG TPA: Gfo/Idh/MocA family oxidoreductase [Pyrinomonadaceae bacterium]|nr:Gfo/Idh/MocA family oxidoreductase [Pyrinomonadaceae bacterium]
MKNAVRIGIIGAGFARTTQIPGFKNCEGAQIVAIASAHRENAEAVAREFDIPNVEDDWRGVVARPDVDLVSIVTPVVTHCEMTLAALDAGKAVLCEKPMAMNADEARRMMERAKEKDVLALIDHELRFLPGRIKTRELVHRGDIGRVKHVQVIFRSESRAHVDRPWNWWSDVKQGGGALGAIGSHMIDSCRWMLGAEVSEVFCKLATHVRERKDEQGQLREVTTDDEANLLLRFEDGELTESATGNVSMSLVEAGAPQNEIELLGSSGALGVGELGEIRQARAGGSGWQIVDKESGELAAGMIDSSWARGFTAFAQEIVAALRAGRTTVEGAATFEDGYQTQLVLDAARRSNEKGRWVRSERPAVAGR